jgi:quinol monooxygenase YgiN
MLWLCSCVLFFITALHANGFSDSAEVKRIYGEVNMSDHVFVVSEWLPRAGKSQELWQHAKRMMALTRKEKGCVRAHATRQITHPGAPGQSKYTIVCLQEYKNLEAFNTHCSSEYVTEFFETCVQNERTAIVDEWTCRLFDEGEETL